MTVLSKHNTILSKHNTVWSKLNTILWKHNTVWLKHNTMLSKHNAVLYKHNTMSHQNTTLYLQNTTQIYQNTTQYLRNTTHNFSDHVNAECCYTKLKSFILDPVTDPCRLSDKGGIQKNLFRSFGPHFGLKQCLFQLSIKKKSTNVDLTTIPLCACLLGPYQFAHEAWII